MTPFVEIKFSLEKFINDCNSSFFLVTTLVHFAKAHDTSVVTGTGDYRTFNKNAANRKLFKDIIPNTYGDDDYLYRESYRL